MARAAISASTISSHGSTSAPEAPAGGRAWTGPAVIFAPVEWMVAGRYLRPRWREGFVFVIAMMSFLGIMLGVGVLIVVAAVFNGFHTAMLASILGFSGHLTVLAPDRVLVDYDRVAVEVRGVPGVVSVTPLILGQVMATNGGRASGALVRGMTPEDLRAKTVIAENIRDGSLGEFTGSDAVAIGFGLARELGLIVGEKVTLISPQGTATVFGTVPRVRAYTVVAIFKVGMSQYDRSFIFMPLAAAQIYFEVGEGINQLEVFTDDPGRVGAIRRGIAAVLDDGSRLFDWQQENAGFFEVIQVERNVTILIVSFIVLVAAFNIISSMIMLVKFKSRDIAILRTMGASRGRVMRIFFITGASIGVIGTAAGASLGTAFCVNIEAIRQFLQSLTGVQFFSEEFYFLSQLPCELESNWVGGVVIMALSLSLLATLYPSWRAARLDPVEALRYE